jgi:hypothetical protein
MATDDYALRYEVITKIDNPGEKIYQETYMVFNNVRERVYSDILNLKEAGIKEALIKMGWTPPPTE